MIPRIWMVQWKKSKLNILEPYLAGNILPGMTYFYCCWKEICPCLAITVSPNEKWRCNENYRTLLKEIEETQRNGKIFEVLGFKEST